MINDYFWVIKIDLNRLVNINWFKSVEPCLWSKREHNAGFGRPGPGPTRSVQDGPQSAQVGPNRPTQMESIMPQCNTALSHTYHLPACQKVGRNCLFWRSKTANFYDRGNGTEPFSLNVRLRTTTDMTLPHELWAYKFLKVYNQKGKMI